MNTHLTKSMSVARVNAKTPQRLARNVAAEFAAGVGPFTRDERVYFRMSLALIVPARFRQKITATAPRSSQSSNTVILNVSGKSPLSKESSCFQTTRAQRPLLATHVGQSALYGFTMLVGSLSWTHSCPTRPRPIATKSSTSWRPTCCRRPLPSTSRQRWNHHVVKPGDLTARIVRSSAAEHRDLARPQDLARPNDTTEPRPTSSSRLSPISC
jgi:hypothetical protein